MSRIGKLPIQLPQSVKLDIKPQLIKVEGPKGKLEVKILNGIEVAVDGGRAIVTRKNETKKVRAFHGLIRKLLFNAVTGVSEGFTRTLLLSGVGYRAEVQKDILILSLGYSNPVEFLIPDGLDITCEGNNKIIVNGIDKQLVGQICAEIRSLRPPEPYKGKGIRYEGETIIRKVGKAGVA